MTQPPQPTPQDVVPFAGIETGKLETGNEDRRGASRVSFAARISVCDKWDPATQADDFHPVKALNLSQTGISFRSTRWPRSDRLLVRFSETGTAHRVRAQVIDCRREELDNGDARYEVRCEFLEWLKG